MSRAGNSGNVFPFPSRVEGFLDCCGEYIRSKLFLLQFMWEKWRKLNTIFFFGVRIRTQTIHKRRNLNKKLCYIWFLLHIIFTSHTDCVT